MLNAYGLFVGTLHSLSRILSYSYYLFGLTGSEQRRKGNWWDRAWREGSIWRGEDRRKLVWGQSRARSCQKLNSKESESGGFEHQIRQGSKSTQHAWIFCSENKQVDLLSLLKLKCDLIDDRLPSGLLEIFVWPSLDVKILEVWSLFISGNASFICIWKSLLHNIEESNSFSMFLFTDFSVETVCAGCNLRGVQILRIKEVNWHPSQWSRVGADVWCTFKAANWTWVALWSWRENLRNSLLS